MNPLFYEIAGVYPDGRVVITHTYAPNFRRELTLKELALAAGKLESGLHHADYDATYLRLFRQARQMLLRRGYCTEVTESSVAITRTPGRVAMEAKNRG